MIKRIKEYFEYRRNVRLVKNYCVSMALSVIANNGVYAEGLKNILTNAAIISDPLKLQKMIAHEIADIIHDDTAEE